ncbi:hypothetical protein Msp_0954 [Methanosphaera stadtmanae DSM 3091]|uniref:Uncharacterized protein n=1 Tax=Methanosphaera stadtmanae (strain ATCC 43021 / DSM 3091 / JCM 11832 / MCB-3) TaxID=339860 RepID=Q2NFR1_METST|nr:hypothetical protein Msp_0954 [Methanosphaera stadtmanae DSM 3091]
MILFYLLFLLLFHLLFLYFNFIMILFYFSWSNPSIPVLTPFQFHYDLILFLHLSVGFSWFASFQFHYDLILFSAIVLNVP